jgi:transcriptional regulator with XRE-family HTH domain
MRDPKSIGEAFKRRRLQLGLTLRDVAKRAKMSHGAIDHIERATRNTTVPTLQRVAAALETTLEIDLQADLAGREGVLERFRRILPHVPQEEIDVFVHELALWERRYRPDSSGRS